MLKKSIGSAGSAACRQFMQDLMQTQAHGFLDSEIGTAGFFLRRDGTSQSASLLMLGSELKAKLK